VADIRHLRNNLVMAIKDMALHRAPIVNIDHLAKINIELLLAPRECKWASIVENTILDGETPAHTPHHNTAKMTAVITLVPRRSHHTTTVLAREAPEDRGASEIGRDHDHDPGRDRDQENEERRKDMKQRKRSAQHSLEVLWVDGLDMNSGIVTAS